MQDIRYMLVRTPYTQDLTRAQASTIAALIHQTATLHTLDLSIREMLGIFLEQAILTQYMLDMNPTNTKLAAYQEKIRYAFNEEGRRGTFNLKKLEAERINPSILRLIQDYVSGKTDYLTGSDLTSIEKITLIGNQYATIPHNFISPYLNFRANAILDEEMRTTPMTLSVRYKRDIDYPDDLILSFYIRPFTSMQKTETLYFKSTLHNKTLSYIASMNFSGYDWKSMVDTVQSCHFHAGTIIGTESLANALNRYLHDRPLPTTVNVTLLRQQFNALFSTLIQRHELVVDEDALPSLEDLYSFLKDDRLAIYLVDELTVGLEEHYTSYHNEEPFKSLELLGFLPGRKKIESYAMADDSGGNDSSKDDSGNDASEDAEENEEMGDDLFGDDGGFGDDEDDEGGDGEEGEGEDESGSQTSTDTSASSSSSTDTSASSDTTKAEDVNPIIEIIDDESFDEYLDRSILSIRLKRLIANPPTSLSSIDLRFLKHWYLQWFPCVSVATTREILGDLLSVPSKKLTSDQ